MSSDNQYEVTPFSHFDERECDMQVRMVPMRDGKKLHTAVYLPPDLQGAAGVVLFRSPYFRREYYSLPSTFALKHSLVAVFQCCRGTASSEGEFFPSHREIEERDGEDTVNWILQQSWCNGRIALMGSSYSGLTQWATVFCGNEAITGLRPHVAALCGCPSMARGKGGSRHGFMIGWGLSMYHRNKFGYNNIPDFDAHLSHLPVNEMDLHFGYGVVEFYRDFIRTAQEPWNLHKGLDERFRKVKAPAFISGGWFDGFKQENILSYKLMKELGATDKARRFTRMYIGPWIHGGLVNKEELGEENDQRELVRQQDRFILNSLKDPDADPTPELPPVQFFMLGENRWCASQTWPPANREKKLFLNADGKLTETSETKSGSSSRYTYDPADPTPSFNGKRNALGYYDRSATEKRKDLLLFTTAPLADVLTITGNVKVRLFARSSAPDTDFFATLSDVYPDGRSMFLITGSVRARFCNSEGKEKFLAPGELKEYEIDLGDIANTFEKGHAVRLAIHSANFPADSRNLNTTAPIHEGVTMVRAFQEICHDAEHPSCLLLPELAEEL